MNQHSPQCSLASISTPCSVFCRIRKKNSEKDYSLFGKIHLCIQSYKAKSRAGACKKMAKNNHSSPASVHMFVPMKWLFCKIPAMQEQIRAYSQRSSTADIHLRSIDALTMKIFEEEKMHKNK